MNADQRRQEEREAFNRLTSEDRAWICFALDIVATGGTLPSQWAQRFDFATFAAASDVLPKAVQIGRQERDKAIWGFDEHLYPPALCVAIFSMRLGQCRTEAAMRFLLERLFGGKVRPFVPSIFVAAALHPDVEDVHEDQFALAIYEKETGHQTSDPLLVNSADLLGTLS